MRQHKMSKAGLLTSSPFRHIAAALLVLSFWGVSLDRAFAQGEPLQEPNTANDNAELTVYEQGQGLWLQCAEKQKASTPQTIEGDYRLCNAVYNALGKAVSSNAYGADDLKWLYFYMGRTSASMALIALSVADEDVSETACASVERADWTFQKVAAENASWEAEVIAQYEIGSLVKTCRGKFGIPKWRQK